MILKQSSAASPHWTNWTHEVHNATCEPTPIMSEESASTPEDILDDLALRHALGTLDADERGPFEASLANSHSQAAALAAEHADLAAAVTRTAFRHEAGPPLELKNRVLAAIRSRQSAPSKTRAALPPHAAALMTTADELPWMATPYRGVRMRELSATPDYAILMLACAPGATFPPHHHAGTEDVYILSGAAEVEGRMLREGDYIHAEPGSHHQDMVSESGCRAIIITSRKNYSPRAARAYDIAHRVVSRVGRALGMTAKG